MEVTFLSAKRSKAQFEVAYERTDEDGSKTTIRELHHTPVHPDLTKAFNGLTTHWACINDFLTVKAVEKVEDKDLEGFKVTSYSIGGKGDDQGIVLTGQRILKSGKTQPAINTPFTRFDEDEKTGYRWIDDLQTKLTALEDEIEKYLFSGKKAEEVQLKMELPEAVN